MHSFIQQNNDDNTEYNVIMHERFITPGKSDII